MTTGTTGTTMANPTRRRNLLMNTAFQLAERAVPRGNFPCCAWLRAWFVVAATIAAAMLGIGCRREAVPASGAGGMQPAGGPAAGAATSVEAPSAGQPTSPAADPSPPSESSVTLRVIDKDGLSAVLQRHRGKVVLVDFWATWCAPCVALLPQTIELGRKFGARGLVVVAVSIDDAADEAAVRETLAESGASGEQYLASYGVGPAAFEAFGIDDGALPHLKLYDREGRLHRAICSGGKPLDKAAIDAAVEDLLE